MVFKPGQSGNPGGRPRKDNDLVILAKSKTKEAFKELLQLLESTSKEDIKLACIKTMFEYGFGKPRQELEVTGEDGGPLIAVIKDK